MGARDRKSPASVVALIAVVAVLSGATVQAAPGDLMQRIPNPNPTISWENFGSDVTCVGDYLVVAANRDVAGGKVSAGTVSIFDRATFALVRTIDNPAPTYEGHFGNSVAPFGSYVLVGATGNIAGGSVAGAAYLMDPSTGTQVRSFISPTPTYLYGFGREVASAGNNVLINEAQVVHIFNGTTGEFLRTLSNPNPSFAGFGGSLAGVGGNALVSSDRAAYLFDCTTGALLRTFTSPDPNFSIGWPVATVGSNVLVGGGRAACLFDGSTGALLATFRDPDPTSYATFGKSLAAVGNNVLVGAQGLEGRAYVYDGATGGLLHTFFATHNSTGFGYSVAATGNDILIGAPFEGYGSTAEPGAAYVYEGVPEPATLSLLAIGGLALVRRRKRR